MGEFRIGDREVGEGKATFLIAEIAQNHDGSLAMAHSYVDLAATCGADAVKFQTHIAAAESTRDEPFRVPIRGGFDSRYEYWKSMQFTLPQWVELKEHAVEREIAFLSSPFSLEAVELLEQVGVAAWKVGSGELMNESLLQAIGRTRTPVILSTGMSTYSEIREAGDVVRAAGSLFAVLQCTSRYPAGLNEVGLNVMDELRLRVGSPVGLSDHSGTVWPGLAAMAVGAAIVEVHLTFDRRIRGPDAEVSLEPHEFQLLAGARDAFSIMASSPVDKDLVASELESMRRLFTKSVAPAHELEAGAVLEKGMLTLKKPGTGIPAAQLPHLLGRRLRRSVAPDRLLSWEDVDD